MTLVEFIAYFNLFSLVVFVVLVVLAAMRMFWRLGLFLFMGTPTPVLLRRDLLLFGAFIIHLGSTLLAVTLRWEGLRDNLLWVVPRTLLVLGAMAYWVWVEYHLDGKE